MKSTELVLRIVENCEELTSVYGHWPSFHDGEVVSIVLHRNEGEPLADPYCLLAFHVFRLEVAPDAPDRDDRLVKLEFYGISDFRLSGFDHQNSIIGFEVENVGTTEAENLDSIYRVVLTGAQRFACDFRCSRIRVVSVGAYVGL